MPSIESILSHSTSLLLSVRGDKEKHPFTVIYPKTALELQGTTSMFYSGIHISMAISLLVLPGMHLFVSQ